MDQYGGHQSFNASLGTYLTFIASDFSLSATGPEFAVKAKCDDLNLSSTDTKLVETRAAPGGLPGIDPTADVEVFYVSCSANDSGAIGYLDKEKLRFAIDSLIAQPAAERVGSTPEDTGALTQFVARPERDPDDHRPIADAGFAKLSYASVGRGSLKSITLKETKKGKFVHKVKRYR